MNEYPAVRNGTCKADKGAHADFLRRKDPNLRLIAVFDPSATPKPYVFLMEQLMSILLQTLNSETVKTYMRASTIAMIRRANLKGSLNNSTTASTGFSPNEMCYGMKLSDGSNVLDDGAGHHADLCSWDEIHCSYGNN